MSLMPEERKRADLPPGTCTLTSCPGGQLHMNYISQWKKNLHRNNKTGKQKWFILAFLEIFRDYCKIFIHTKITLILFCHHVAHTLNIFCINKPLLFCTLSCWFFHYKIYEKDIWTQNDRQTNLSPRSLPCSTHIPVLSGPSPRFPQPWGLAQYNEQKFFHSCEFQKTSLCNELKERKETTFPLLKTKKPSIMLITSSVVLGQKFAWLQNI